MSAAAPEAASWPFLVVLLSAAPEAEKTAEASRVRGLGWIVGEYVVTLARVAERANVALHLDDPFAIPFERLAKHETFAVLRVDAEVTSGRAASLSEMTLGAQCTVAIVRDDSPQVRLVPGKVEKDDADGRFTVSLDGTLPEDYTASGSPVVSRDGTVFGIVGPTATSTSVDAFRLDELRRLIPGPQAPDTPTLALSETSRNALGYALALTVADGSPIGADAAVLLGVLRSAVDETRPTVPRELLTFIVGRRAPDAQPPAATLVDATVGMLGAPVPPYPFDPPLDDQGLVSSALAPVLARAEAFRARIDPAVGLRRRYLLAAVLTQPVTAFPAPLLETLGATLVELRTALRDAAVRSGEQEALWDELLAEPPPPVDLLLAGELSSDRVDPTKGIPLERDDLGVADYVTMFATAIARKQTPMPLSFGLFGEWGSGKSYFMGLLREQVAALARSGDGRCHDQIVQIGFNAWHYSDSNLWASLGDEIFERLAGPDETNEARRRKLREELGEKLQRRKELEDATEHATAEIARLTRSLDEAAEKREETAGKFLQAVLSAPELGDELQRALARLGAADELEQARLLAGELSQTPEDVAVIRRALGGWHRWVLSAILALATAVVVFAAIASRAWLAGGGAVIVASALAAAGLVIARVRSGARLLRQVADRLRQEKAAGLAARLEALRRAEAEQQVRHAQLDEVTAQVGELGRELAELSPGQRLYRFIAERAAGETYRGQLSLISTIRKDFEQLIVLMKDWQTRTPTKDEPNPPRPVDRIVLYIDDLDRCSPEQVVDVLQAVHLLLALDLFVVVVGVDPRWLLRALRRQYRSMLTSGPQPTGQDPWWETTPQDYLEKIFNIPFVLPRMNPETFEQLVRRVVEPIPETELDQLTEGVTETPDASTVTDTETDDGGAADGGEAPRSALTEQLGRERARQESDEGDEADAEPQPTDATPADERPLTGDELRLLAALAPLVETPRETKRLLNLYRMIRSSPKLSPAARFLGEDGSPGDYEAVVILLGLLSGHARLLQDVLVAARSDDVKGGLRHRGKDERWAHFVAGMKPRSVDSGWENDIVGPIAEVDVEGWKRLADGLAPASKLVTIRNLEPFQHWAPRVARFSFLLSPFAQEEASLTSPADRPPAAVS